MNIVVTGASKGLGKAIFGRLSSKNQNVLGISRTITPGRKENEMTVRVDITEESASEIISNYIGGHWNEVDVLINNAGRGSYGYDLDSTKPVEVLYQVNLHCVGALRVTKACYRFLMRSDNPLVLNVTSRLGSVHRNLRKEFVGGEFSYGYRIAKAAQNMLTLCLIQDASMHRIKVISLNPGMLRTDSGPSDARYTAEEAAERLLDWLFDSSEKVNGTMIHLFGETTEW